MNLAFDPEKHEYRLGERRLVSVTQALSLVDDRRKDPYFLQRGRFIHLACELWDKGELSEETLDSAILPRLEAWKSFRADTGFTPRLIEQRLFHPIYLYGMTLDRQGPLNGADVLIDIKSSPAPVDVLQNAAYWAGLMAQDPPIPTKKAFDVYLKDNGKYSLVETKFLRRDFLTFLAILTAYRWKEKL